MSLIRRCDICGRELSDLNPIRLDWVKITTTVIALIMENFLLPMNLVLI